MAYWRMQLHPGGSREACKHAVQNLAAGFVGFGLGLKIGDLTITPPEALPAGQRDYAAFAREMAVGDRVLIVVHHFPFALCRVAGDYNYIRDQVPEIGIWCRHFRRVDEIRYYSDFKTNAREWEPLTMTDTLSPLRDSGSKSHRLIDEWLATEPS